MYKLLAVVCVGLFVHTVYSAVARQPPIEPPMEFECEEGCYSKTLNMMLPVGVPYSPQDGKSCLQYTCEENRGYTQIFSCGSLNAPGCTPTQDFSLPYPDCCPQIKNCTPTGPITATG